MGINGKGLILLCIGRHDWGDAATGGFLKTIAFTVFSEEAALLNDRGADYLFITSHPQGGLAKPITWKRAAGVSFRGFLSDLGTTPSESLAERQEFFRSEAKPQDRFQYRPLARLMAGDGWVLRRAGFSPNDYDTLLKGARHVSF
jgi:hypothetical protein